MCKSVRIVIFLISIVIMLSGILFALLRVGKPLSVADVAADVTANCNSTKEKSMAVYRYMTRNFRYNYELCDAILAKEITQYTVDPQQTLDSRKGICCDLAVLCAAMLESQGVEVKIIKGYFNGVYHAWNSVYEEETGTWEQIDVTSDLWIGRSRTEWPEFDAAQYTVRNNVDYSGQMPLTFGTGTEKP